MRVLSRKLNYFIAPMLALYCLIAGPAPSVSAAPPQKVEVLIAFKKVPQASETALVKSFGGSVKRSFVTVPAVAATLPVTAVAALSKHKDVALVEPDGQIYLLDFEMDSVWGVRRVGADQAHAASPAIKGAGVNIAILDTGIDYRHPDLAGNYRGGWDFVNNDNDPLDDNGHGTHIAGTIAALDNDAGVVGVAPEANLYALKVLDSTGYGSFSNMIAALDWCVTNGVRIDLTNNSYGSYSDPGYIVEQAFVSAHFAGILNFAAAGNAGTSAGTENNIAYPARYASVVAVGATTSSDSRATFSCTGPTLEIAAPGQSIYSTLRNGGYGGYSGTSMACPHAVGVAALLLQGSRDYWGAGATTNDYIREILTVSAVDLGAAGRDTWFGWGLASAPTGLNALMAIPPSASNPSSPPAPEPAPVLTMRVSSVAYQSVGRKKADLSITVTIVDENGQTVPGAAVNTRITCTATSAVYGGTATTDSSGKATFKISNAPKGTWTTTVNSVGKDGFQWDGSNTTSTYSNSTASSKGNSKK